LKLDFNFAESAIKSENDTLYQNSSGVKPVKSSNRAAAHVLPSDSEDRQVEVILEDGGASVALRLSTWTEGLGWCAQKTIRLDVEQLEDLHHAISVARHRLNRQRAQDGQFRPAAQVIQLPTIA
jgi:hypothetical protein